jgi:hypothetical protein
MYSFNFPKMHELAHLWTHLQSKGSAGHIDTCWGEGKMPDFKRSYSKSNYKNYEIQVSRELNFLDAANYLYLAY